MSWTIIKEFKNRRTFVEVKCDCGVVETRRKDQVLSGRTKGCKKCSCVLTLKKFPNKKFGPRPHEEVGDISLTLWQAIKSGAKAREIPFKIDISYAWNLFEKQGRKCALSGVDLALKHGYKNNNVCWADITASLDRIDSEKAYVKGNVQWVHKIVNRMKGDIPETAFIAICKCVSVTNRA